MGVKLKLPSDKLTSKSTLTCIEYSHTAAFKGYMANPVSAEKKILINRGLDEFNVGHTTRSFEIEHFVDSEFRDAGIQMGNHLDDYKNEFAEKLSELAAKKDEADQLSKDLAGLKNHINNLTSILTEEESQ